MSPFLDSLRETSKALLDAMESIGNKSGGISLRYDPWREKNKWTIISGSARVCDTDDPIAVIVTALREGEKDEGIED